MWMVYYLQGVLYKEGGLFSQSLLVILLLISLYYFFYAISRYRLPKPMRILSAMIIIWSVYGIIPIIFGTGKLAIRVAPFEYLKNIYMSLLPIYTFYVFVKKGDLNEDMLRRWLVVFVLVAISSFYKQQSKLVLSALSRGSSETEFTNNAGYIMVSLLPMLALLWKKPLWQYILLGVCMTFVLMAYKRGAILAGTICSIWLIYVSFKNEQQVGSKVSNRRMMRLVLTLLIVIASVFLVQYFLTTSDYFSMRVESTRGGYTSNRDNIYSFFYNYFLHDMSPLDYLIGLGANGTLKIYENAAHNDWLEIAIDNGVIMLILYFAYWLSMFKMFFKGNNHNMSNLMFGMFVIVYFLKSYFSMSYSDIPVYSSCALGYSMATYFSKTKKVYLDS